MNIADLKIISENFNCSEFFEFVEIDNSLHNDKFYLYRFIDIDDRIIYIGKTINLKSRIKSHSHLPLDCYKSTSKIEYMSVSNKIDMTLTEIYLINKYKPIYNTQYKFGNDMSKIFTLQENEWTEYEIPVCFGLNNRNNKSETDENILNYIHIYGTIENPLFSKRELIRIWDRHKKEKQNILSYISQDDYISEDKFLKLLFKYGYCLSELICEQLIYIFAKLDKYINYHGILQKKCN